MGGKNDGFGPSGSESKIIDHAKENKHMSHPTIPPLCRKVNSSYCRQSGSKVRKPEAAINSRPFTVSTTFAMLAL